MIRCLSNYHAGLLIVLCVLIPCCGRLGSAPTRVTSPDGSKVLIASPNPDKTDRGTRYNVVVEIQDLAGETLFRVVTPASDVQRWSIQWRSDQEIYLDSSDVGGYIIRQQPDGNWLSSIEGYFGVLSVKVGGNWRELSDPSDAQVQGTIASLVERPEGSWKATFHQDELHRMEVSGDVTKGFLVSYWTDRTSCFHSERWFTLEEVVQAMIEYRDRMIDWADYGEWLKLEWPGVV